MSSSAFIESAPPEKTSPSLPDLSLGVFSSLPTADVALAVRRLSKSYTIAHNDIRATTAAEALVHRLKNPFHKLEKETFWALQDVSFDVQKGDVVGIIGRNGAGKSTLLKVLSRITAPTTGEIDLYGRVGSLLEVGTGFHQELTGRENIFLNGAILGMKRREIERHFDAIVEFAGVERFLDTPVKRYSSGMYVRLAFAVAAHLSADILVVDEVLAVGDAEFQKKCLGKMQDVAKQEGRTVLFVSHQMAAVSNLCSSAVVLDQGKVAFYGETQEAVQRYLNTGARGADAADRDLRQFRPSWATPFMTAARVLDGEGQEQTCFPLGADITFELTFSSHAGMKVRTPVMGLVINHATFGAAGGVNMRMTDYEITDGPYETATMRCTLKRFPFLQGQYTVDLWLGDGAADIDSLAGYLSFEIEASDIYGSGRTPFNHLGVVFLEPAWEFIMGRK